MKAEHLFAGIAVSDTERSWSFYERLFGSAWDMAPTEAEVVWRLSSGASVYVVRDAARAGRCLVTIAVADLEGWLGAATERAVEFRRVPAGQRQPASAIVVDPDGNTIKLFGTGGSAS